MLCIAIKVDWQCDIHCTLCVSHDLETIKTLVSKITNWSASKNTILQLPVHPIFISVHYVATCMSGMCPHKCWKLAECVWIKLWTCRSSKAGSKRGIIVLECTKFKLVGVVYFGKYHLSYLNWIFCYIQCIYMYMLKDTCIRKHLYIHWWILSQ